MLSDFPKDITYEGIKKIVEQMEESIWIIKINNKIGTGFFCEIPFQTNNFINVLITRNQILNEPDEIEKADIFMEGKCNFSLKCFPNRKMYSSPEYDNLILNDILKNESDY